MDFGRSLARFSRTNFLRYLSLLALSLAGAIALPSLLKSKNSSQPPSGVSGVDPATGNWLLNGVPTVLIMGEVMGYAAWEMAGYTFDQADAKIKQMIAAGVNVFWGDWAAAYTKGLQSDLHWSQHKTYWSAPATQSIIDSIILTVPPTGKSNLSQVQLDLTLSIVNKHKNLPYLVRWSLGPDEIDPSPENYSPANHAKLCGIVYKNAPQPVGDDIILAGDWTTPIGATLEQLPFGEYALCEGPTSGSALDQLYRDGLRYLPSALQAKKLFCPAISTKLTPELIPGEAFASGNSHVVSLAEQARCYLFQIAVGCRAFTVGWGANVRDTPVAPNNGDIGLPPGYLNVWRDAQTILRTYIAPLAQVILDPAKWQTIPTNPSFSGDSMPLRGVYAAKKTVAGETFVIAINTNIDNQFKDLPVISAAINVGQSIRTVTRFAPETGPVRFSGSTITDDFVAGGYHVYVVR